MDRFLSIKDYIISHITPTENGGHQAESNASSSSSECVEERKNSDINNNNKNNSNNSNNNNNNNSDNDNNNSNNNDVFMDGGFLLVDLPDEVVLHVFTFMDAKCITGSLQFVNWRLNNLCQENRLWKKITHKTWSVKEKPKFNWKSYHLLKTHLQSEGSIEWMRIPPIGLRPSRRYQNTSTTVGSKIYLIGGQESAFNRFNDIFEFDTETYTFTRVAIKKDGAQPPSFARHIAVAIGSKIWVHGGFDGHGTYFGVSVFDVEDSSWTYIETTGDKPTARTNHAAAAIGKYIYIYGGIKRNLIDTNVLEDLGDMFVLDTETHEWREEICENMPPPRCGHKMLALRGKLYLFGGGAGEDWAIIYNDINVYDPATKVWTRIETPGPDTSTFSCMFAMDPFIFVFGGQCKQEKQCSQIVYCYDTLAHSWTTAIPGPTKPDARDMATMSVCGHSAFLFGGYNQKCFDDVFLLRLTKTANRALETLALSDETPASPLSSPSFPSSFHSSSFSPLPSSSFSPLPSSSSARAKDIENEEDEDGWEQ